jgi:hypothetical protein
MSEAVAAAYGLRFRGLESGRWLGVTGAGHWPCVSVTSNQRADAPELELDINRLELRVRAGTAHGELVHPLLGRVASHLALAMGADGMHAGAIAGTAGAWAVIGPKGAGKSTLLAGLNDIGVPIVTDDVLVFRDGVVTAGPRCIDLRPDATGFGLTVAVRPSDPRKRLSLPPIAAEHRLAGLLHLEWSSDEVGIERLDHREAIRRLMVLRSDRGYPRDPRTLLGLAALPTAVLKRPKSKGSLAAAVAEVARFAGAGAPVRREKKPLRRGVL